MCHHPCPLYNLLTCHIVWSDVFRKYWVSPVPGKEVTTPVTPFLSLSPYHPLSVFIVPFSAEACHIWVLSGCSRPFLWPPSCKRQTWLVDCSVLRESHREFVKKSSSFSLPLLGHLESNTGSFLILHVPQQWPV